MATKTLQPPTRNPISKSPVFVKRRSTGIQIEDIDAVRLREGIDDVGLRKSVAQLGASDRVCLSISLDGKSFEKVSVRITSCRGGTFRGKLLSKPHSTGLRDLDADRLLVFSASQIHSIITSRGATAVAACDHFSKGQADDDGADSDDYLLLAAGGRFKRAPAAQKIARTRRRPLRVEGDALRRFIRVPVGLANDLHKYLRSRKVRSSPPQPYYCDCDCIELDRTIDVAGVQAVLDQWRHPH
jgi:hypothetical protein